MVNLAPCAKVGVHAAGISITSWLTAVARRRAINDFASAIKKAAQNHARLLCRPRPALIKGSVACLVNQLVLGNPRHHGTEFSAHLFNLVLGIQTASDDYEFEIRVTGDTSGQTVTLVLDQATGKLKLGPSDISPG